MIRELPSPDFNFGFYTELVSRESPRFQELSPIPRGTLYSTCKGGDPAVNTAHPVLYFLRETVPIGSNTVAGMEQSEFVKWHWMSVPDAEGIANATIEYLGDAVANPVYARVFTVRRDTYDITPTLALGTAFTGLIGIKVTAAGTGYLASDTVNIAGSLGGAAKLVVNENGAISHVVISAEGSGYNSASLPAVTITTATGSGATLVAIVQPVAAVLTSQKKAEFDEGDPRKHNFVQVLRTYEVLPGPLLPFTRYDDDLGPIQCTRRAVVNTGQASSVGAGGRTTYEAREGSSYVLWELVEGYTTALYDAYYRTIPITLDLDLPDVLVTLTAAYEVGGGNGEFDSDGDSAGTSFNLSLQGSANASAAVIPRLFYTIDRTPAIGVPATQYEVLLANPATLTQLKARLAAVIGPVVSGIAAGVVTTATAHGMLVDQAFQFTSLVGGAGGIAAAITYYTKVITDSTHFTYAATLGGAALTGHSATSAKVAQTINNWPKFRPKALNFNIHSEKMSVEVRANSHNSASEGTFSTSHGEGYSTDYSPSLTQIDIPPTLHGAFTFDGEEAAPTKTVETDVSQYGTSPITSHIGPLDCIATGRISPASVAATSPASIPTSGLYLYKYSGRNHHDGYIMFICIVVDMANV